MKCILQMQTAEFERPPAPLLPNNDRVCGATLVGGLKIVVVRGDQRLGLSELLPAYLDQRRIAVAVYEISRALGFHLVPATTYRLIDGHIELVRVWIGDAMFLDGDHRVNEYKDESLHVLDYLTEQLDRNHDGLVVRPGGYLVALDNKHALDFGLRNLIDPDGLPSMRPPTTITTSTREGLKRFRELLHAGSIGKFRGLNPAEISRIEAKIDHLLTLPTVANATPSRFSYDPRASSARDVWRRSFMTPRMRASRRRAFGRRPGEEKSDSSRRRGATFPLDRPPAGKEGRPRPRRG